MAEIKFKHGTQEDYESVTRIETDVYFTQDSSLSEGSNVKVGSIYRGDEIVGTTDADKLLLKENFTVAGTTVGNIVDGKTFEAGTSIYDILSAMLQKEIIPSAITQPNTSTTVAISPSNSICEVGTEIVATVKAVYTDGKYDTYTSENKTSTSKLYLGTTLDADGYTIKRLKPTAQTFEDKVLSGVTVSDTVILSTEGSQLQYSANANRSGATYTVMSNMGNISEDKVFSSGTTSDDSPVAATAYYKYFYGNMSNFNAETISQSDLTQLASGLLDSSKTFTGGESNTGGTRFMVVIPSNKDFTCIDALATGTDWKAIGKFTEKTFTYVNNGTETNYSIWYLSDGGVVSYSSLKIIK